MQGFVAVTDPGWLATLRSANATEANFWQPRPTAVRQRPGTPWIFKIRGTDRVGGFGFFSYYTIMPAAIAWEAFGLANGAKSYREMAAKVRDLRRSADGNDDVGCVVLSELTVLEDEARIAAPHDWKRNIVRGAGYDLSSGEGLRIWNELRAMTMTQSRLSAMIDVPGGYGEPALHVPRRGQGAFRVMVMDAYDRRCAITGERTLPALEAAHIRPFAEHATHEVKNGILMRGDLHKLFDRGYVTVDESERFRVSPSIAREFNNGRVYYELDGKEIRRPNDPAQQPDREALAWHAATIFRP